MSNAEEINVDDSAATLLSACVDHVTWMKSIGFYSVDDDPTWLQWESPRGSNVDLGFRINAGRVVLWSNVVPIKTRQDLLDLIRLVSG